CESDAAIRASRRKRFRKSGSPARCAASTFSATRRPISVSSAAETIAIPPRPSSRSSSYLVAFVLVSVPIPVPVSVFVVMLLVAVGMPLAVLLRRRGRGRSGRRGRGGCRRGGRADRGVRLHRLHAREQLGAQPYGHAPCADERVRLRRERGDVALRCA